MGVGEAVAVEGSDDVAAVDRRTEAAAVVVAPLAGVPLVPADDIGTEDAPLVVTEGDADVAGRRLGGQPLDERDDAVVVWAPVYQVAVKHEDVLRATGPVERAVVVGRDQRVVVVVVAERPQRAAGGAQIPVDVADTHDQWFVGVDARNPVAGRLGDPPLVRIDVYHGVSCRTVDPLFRPGGKNGFGSGRVCQQTQRPYRRPETIG